MASGTDAEGSPTEQPKSQTSIADDAIRTIEEVRALLESVSPADLPERAAAVRAKLDSALGSVEKVAREEGTAIADGLLKGQETIEREIESVEEQIRQHPLDSVLIAAGVGFLIGLMVRRGK